MKAIVYHEYGLPGCPSTLLVTRAVTKPVHSLLIEMGKLKCGS
jgi:hypothetical protein